MDRPLLKIAPEVMVALRMGLFQLWYLDRIPDHAAISESVELCRATNNAYATGMVNAVLRKLARAGKPAAAARKLVVTPAFLAAEYAHPEWLVARWVKSYGAAATEKILAGGPGESRREAAESLCGSRRAQQIDAGSRLIAEIAAAGAAKKHSRLLRCAWRQDDGAGAAASGGEDHCDGQQRAAAGAYAEAAAWAGECEVRAGRCGEDRRQYELILCDVPCSGTGTLARNPEIRHKLQPADLSKQTKRQREILSSALRALEPGGRLIYSTCSLEPEENEQVVEAVLRDAEDVRVLPMAEILAELRCSHR